MTESQLSKDSNPRQSSLSLQPNQFEPNWQNYCQLSYDSLIMTRLKGFKSISQIKWSTETPTISNQIGIYKMIFYTAGSKQSYGDSTRKGILSQFQIWIPKTEEDQGKLNSKPIVNQIDLFEDYSEIRILQEFPSENKDSSLFATANDQLDIKLFKNSKFRQGQVSILKGHKSQIQTIKHDPYAYFQQSRGVLSGDQSGQIIWWDLNKGYQNQTLSKKTFKNISSKNSKVQGIQSILCIAWMPKKAQSSFISCSNSLDSAITIWDLRSSQNVCKYTAKNGHTGTVNTVCPLTKTYFVSGGNDGNIIFWDIRNQRNYIQRQQSHTQARQIISLSQNQADIGIKAKFMINKTSEPFFPMYSRNYLKQTIKFASCNKDGTVIIWNEALEYQFLHKGHQNQKVTVDYRPYEECFISGENKKNTVMLWRPGFMSNYHQKTMLLEGRNIKESNFNIHEKMMQNSELFGKKQKNQKYARK